MWRWWLWRRMWWLRGLWRVAVAIDATSACLTDREMTTVGATDASNRAVPKTFIDGIMQDAA
jgi:hypothetical protein